MVKEAEKSKNIGEESEELKKERKDSQNKQIKLILMGMVILFLVAFGVYWVTYNKSNFTYGGLDFRKLNQGELEFYIAEIEKETRSVSITGQVINEGAEYFQLTFRNDPRTLKDIPISGEINFRRETVLSFERDIEACEDNLIAVTNFVSFLNFAGVSPKGGSFNETYAEETGIPYATCENTPNKTVIIVKSSEDIEKTEIIQLSDDCYEVRVNNCEIVDVLERLMIVTAAKFAGFDLI